MLQRNPHCIHCDQIFQPNLRHPNQRYCPDQVCQKARKANWQKEKMKSDYRENQRMSSKKWREKNSGYWCRYRQQNPQKAQRNKKLQHIRNFRIRKKKTSLEGKGEAIPLIAKMDVVKAPSNKVLGLWYMVPVIAKMDVVNSGIFEISVRYNSASK